MEGSTSLRVTLSILVKRNCFFTKRFLLFILKLLAIFAGTEKQSLARQVMGGQGKEEIDQPLQLWQEPFKQFLYIDMQVIFSSLFKLFTIITRHKDPIQYYYYYYFDITQLLGFSYAAAIRKIFTVSSTVSNFPRLLQNALIVKYSFYSEQPLGADKVDSGHLCEIIPVFKSFLCDCFFSCRGSFFTQPSLSRTLTLDHINTVRKRNGEISTHRMTNKLRRR